MQNLFDLERLLEARFGLTGFRKGQRAIIESVLAGRDAMAVMPTGGGKSLCYQLPALVLDRLVIVISPLIALMNDQVKNLTALDIPAGALHSQQSPDEKRAVFSRMKSGGAFVLYLSPERVQRPGFIEWLREQDVGLFAIDESHCVSQWGPDFRQDYAKLDLLRREKPEVPLLALTASATPTVLDDIEKRLGLCKIDRHVHGFYRPNLFYQVIQCEDEDEKTATLIEAVRKTPEGRILIYCGTRQGVETLAERLRESFVKVGSSHLAEQIDFYHAGMSGEARLQAQNRMASGAVRILCATNAFGMGIDYPDVRMVAHFQMPANIESFYQEMGRAGRDGRDSRCLLLYAKKDRGLQSFFIQQSKADARVIASKWKALDAMTLFAEGGECRHAGILTYFRDSDRIRRCGHCDICAPQSPWLVQKSVAQRSDFRARRFGERARSQDRSQKLESPEAELRADVLREWRRRYAEENDVASFIIFSNRTLIDLANKNPRTLGELHAVYGLAERKIALIGEILLRELRAADGQ